jgi:tripartite-type tricarboxylate transporter receptor subunit TctC
MKRLAVLVLVAVVASMAPAGAQPRFFEGKTIRIVVGFSAGGGYDTYSRVIARHLGRHLTASRRSSSRTCPAPAA